MESVASFQSPPPAGARWVCLRSQAISKLVFLELAAVRSEDIGPELRGALTKLTQNGLLKPLPVWIALDAAIWLSQRLEEQERQETALRYLIMRRANYDLLHRLFKITRARWYALRAQLGAPSAGIKRAPEPARAEIDLVYNTWHRLMKEHPSEIDRWVLLVSQIRHIPVLSLYKLIYDEEGQS